MNRRNFLAGAVVGAAAAAVGAASCAASEPDSPLPPVAPPPGPREPRGRQSYSQQGEDIVLFHLLHHQMRIENPTYIDIGAADPIISNNTYLLHWAGGHGVLVEPNPVYFDRLRMHRPHDIVLRAGIGVTDATEADYYVIRGQPPLNTFSPDEVESLRQKWGTDIVERVVRMPLVSVNHVIESCLGAAPDLLSIDVEGLDLAILRTLDFRKYRPAAIIAETLFTGPRGKPADIVAFLAGHGYEIRGGSMYNVIFADPARYA